MTQFVNLEKIKFENMKFEDWSSILKRAQGKFIVLQGKEIL